MNTLALPELLETVFQTTIDSLYKVDGIQIIEKALTTLASDNTVIQRIPNAKLSLDAFLKTKMSGDTEETEYALIELYLSLHGGGHNYDKDETLHLDKRRGLRCLPGGLLPLLLAQHLVRPDTVFADLGSGNGLQGLLLRKLKPHTRTIQIELSGTMIDTGKYYQAVLGLPPESIRWDHNDIVQADFSDVTLLYLYRPARPVDEGNRIYRQLAEKISAILHPLTIVSVADCFGQFLDNRFSVVYQNEFLTFFSNT